MMPQVHGSTTRQRGKRRMLHFPDDHPIGLVLIRDEAKAARTVEQWRRWAASQREDLLSQLQWAGLGPAWCAAEVDCQEDDDRQWLIAVEAGTWQRRRAARGTMRVAVTDKGWLQVDSTVTDLSSLRALDATALHRLTLSCPIGDDDLAWVASLRSLRYLDILDGGRLTGAGLARLGSLTELMDLTLYRAQVTDDDMAFLRMLTDLRSLTLDCSGPGVAALAHLANLHQIETLHLGGIRLTDEAVPYLRGLTALQDLYGDAGGMSAAGWLRLRNVLPDCQLWLRGSPVPPDVGAVDLPPAFEMLMSPHPGKRKIARQRGLRRSWQRKDDIWPFECPGSTTLC